MFKTSLVLKGALTKNPVMCLRKERVMQETTELSRIIEFCIKTRAPVQTRSNDTFHVWLYRAKFISINPAI